MIFHKIERGRLRATALSHITTLTFLEDWCYDNNTFMEEIGSGLPNQTIFAVRREGLCELIASFMYLGGDSVSCLEYREDEPLSFEEKTQANINLIIEAPLKSKNIHKNLFSETGEQTHTKIYFACPTGKRRDQIVSEFGSEFGACLTPTIFNNITARKMPWFFDNGAFSSFSHGSRYDKIKFYKRLIEIFAKVSLGEINNPDFIVLPDIVGSGKKSLEYSKRWMTFLNSSKLGEFKYYLAIQDGMAFSEVEELIASKSIDGLFLGGTKPWKYATGSKWCTLANKYNMKIHVGGVGVKSKIEWAESCGFTSVDSGVAMLHPKHLNEVLDKVRRDLSLREAI